MAALSIVDFLKTPKKATLKILVVQQESEDEYLIADNSQLAHLIATEHFRKGRKHLSTRSYLRVILPSRTSSDNTIYLDEDSTLVPCTPFATVPVEHGGDTTAKLKSGLMDTPLDTAQGFSPGDLVPSILVKVVKLSEGRKVGNSTVVRATIKDVHGSKTALSLWNTKAKGVREGHVYRIRNVKIDNFPPNESPKHFSTTFKSTFVEEDGTEFEGITIVDEKTEGTVVGVSEFFFYMSCPFCFKKLHEEMNKCKHCNSDVGFPRDDFKSEIHLQVGEEIFKFVVFKRVLEEVVSDSNALGEDMATTERQINECLEDQRICVESINQSGGTKIVHSLTVLPNDSIPSVNEDDDLME